MFRPFSAIFREVFNKENTTLANQNAQHSISTYISNKSHVATMKGLEKNHKTLNKLRLEARNSE